MNTFSFYRKSIYLGLFFFHLILPLMVFSEPERTFKVGLLVMATGKYTYFLDNLLTTADQFFLPDHERTYFIFTDGHVPDNKNIVRIQQERLGWPYDTMMRFQVYFSAADSFKDMDYLYACDADMLFVDTVGDEILGERVGTRHPGFVLPENRHDDYDRNEQSTAYVAPGHGQYYFAGGFYGASKDEFLRLAVTCSQKILQDLSRNIIALWHDESHLNRYFIDNPPTVILSPSYCYPDVWDLPFDKKLLAITKNHAAFRGT